MEAYEVPQPKCSFKQAPQIIGQAQQIYAGLTPDDAKDYKKLKGAILKRYGVNERTTYNGSDKPEERKEKWVQSL